MHTILKVVIGIGSNGQHAYPDFNQIERAIRESMDWSVYVDKFGSGWMYDSVCGHRDHDDYSPQGSWLGFLLVPDDFAQAAIALFGDVCSIVTEEECEWFYDQRNAIAQPELNVDRDVAERLERKQDRGESLTTGELQALDPEHPSPGVVRNKLKTWEGIKSQRNYEIRTDLQKGNARWENRPAIAGPPS